MNLRDGHHRWGLGERPAVRCVALVALCIGLLALAGGLRAQVPSLGEASEDEVTETDGAEVGDVETPAEDLGQDDAAKTDEDAAAGPRLGSSLKVRLQVGVEITAQGSPCGGVVATVPVPMDWPEQKVSIVREDISPLVRQLNYRTLADGVRQMVVQIPLLPAGQSAKALVTFEVERFEILEPSDPSGYRVASRPSREFRDYLGPSPQIESRHVRVREAARSLNQEDASAWEQVEAIYDFVREKVEYREGPLKGAVDTLADGTADCEGMTSLFVALCRAQRIPARCVWVTDHCYPEFYLEDAEGNGHWIPCQVAGTRAFGSMPDITRVILQKGDNIYDPERRTRERYIAEHLRVKSLRGNPPQVNFVRQFVQPE